MNYGLDSIGIQTEIDQVSFELRKQWSEDKDRNHACLMNFAIYSEDPKQLVTNSEYIDQITKHHACRSLLISVDPANQQTEQKAWVKVHCQLSNGKKFICCEQISYLFFWKKQLLANEKHHL